MTAAVEESAVVEETASLSAECQLAMRPGYTDLHLECRQTKDIPLPHGGGILLQRHCGCICHRLVGRTS